MKNIFPILITLLFISSFGFGQMQNVNAIQFNQLIQSGEGVILDVRTPREYDRGHIESSTLISISDREFVNKISLLQKDKPIYIYCLTGSRSRSAGNYMAKIGFTKVYNLERGILEWQRYSLPITVSTQAVASNSKVYSNDSFNQLLKSKELVLVDFHAVWCAPCKKMSPIIEQLKNDFDGDVKIEKIDVEANRKIAQNHQIESIPGFVLFKNGNKVWTHTGIISHTDLANVLKNNL